MAKFENLTESEANAKVNELISSGYKETVRSETAPAGKYVGNPNLVIRTVQKIVNKVKQSIEVQELSYQVVTFTRSDKNGEDLNLFFKAISFDCTNIDSAKVYKEILIKATDELLSAYSIASNLSKSSMMECTWTNEIKTKSRMNFMFLQN